MDFEIFWLCMIIYYAIWNCNKPHRPEDGWESQKPGTGQRKFHSEEKTFDNYFMYKQTKVYLYLDI